MTPFYMERTLGRPLGYEGAVRPGRRNFCAYFWFTGWDLGLQLGVSICVSEPNIEIHVPFGFIRLGWQRWPELPTGAKEK